MFNKIAFSIYQTISLFYLQCTIPPLDKEKTILARFCSKINNVPTCSYCHRKTVT